MDVNNRNRWRGIALSLSVTFLFGVLVYVGLTESSSATVGDFPRQVNDDRISTPLTDTESYTVFLPLAMNLWCQYQSARPLLQGTADYAGEVEILTPLHCTTGLPAEEDILTTGTYTRTPDNVTLWVLAFAPNFLYYVQSPNACEGELPFQENGEWNVPIYLGEKGGESEWFDIVVILTDQTTSQFLSDWVRQGCLDGDYRGITPTLLNTMAITEKDFITIQTVE